MRWSPPSPTRIRRKRTPRSPSSEVGSAAVVAFILLAAGCGGGSDGAAESASTTAPRPTVASPPPDSNPAEPSTTGAPPADPPPADFEPGDVNYRVINLLDAPVDLYARTQGIVEAFQLDLGVAPLSVSQFFAPPTNGRFLITEDGATDVTCVATCPQFITELTPFADDGLVHTVVVYQSGDGRSAFDLWELPTAASAGNANALTEPDPSTGLVIVTAVALTDADFGLRLGFDGVPGCQSPANDSEVLVGGNQTPPFAYDGAMSDVLLYDNQDRDCTGSPVGGPFTIVGGPGTRTHLVLHGSPGSIGAVVVPMEGDVEPDPTDEASDDSVRDLAIEAMAAGLVGELGLPDDQAQCAGGLIVDALGLELLVVDGALVDLDSLPSEAQSLASDALVQSIEICGIDPTVLSG